MQSGILSASHFRSRKKPLKEPPKRSLPPVNEEIVIVKIINYKRQKKDMGTYRLIEEYSHGYLGIRQDGKEEYFRKSDFEVGLLEFTF